MCSLAFPESKHAGGLSSLTCEKLVPGTHLALPVGQRPRILTQADTGMCLRQQGFSILLLPHRFAQMKSEANQFVA